MASQSNGADPKLTRSALVALVVGSMVGSGIFALPAAFGQATGAFGAMIAWVIAGAGMLMLALVFQTLSRRKPDLDAGIFAYARAGFGDYLGFASAVGYWIGCCLADVACLVLIRATLGQFFPVFGDGTTPTAIAAASAILWGVHLLVLRGIKGAAVLNTIATYAKIVPIFLFIVVIIVAFDGEVFSRNFWGAEPPEPSNILAQVRGTMLLTVFVFVGIEGASVYSRYAQDRDDIGLATVLGFLVVLSLLVLVTLLSYGVLPRSDLAALRTPSMAGVMEAMVGPWGSVFISVGLLISVLGNYLSWSLLAAEVLRSAALQKTMPSFLARQNAYNAPVGALWLPEAAGWKLAAGRIPGPMEAGMNIQAIGGTLIIGVLLTVAPLSSRSLAQGNDANVSAPQNATPHTNRASPKHRYWRFRGGKHPHHGSRRVRT